MILVRAALDPRNSDVPAVAIRVDRQKLSRRLWRATAEDGTDFGFEVESPLTDGDVVFVSASTRYVIRQAPEPIIAVVLPETPEAAAIVGWAIGNMHFVIEARGQRLLAPDDPALRQSLERIGIAYDCAVEVFQPNRLARDVAHSHAPAADHPYIRPMRHDH